MQIKGKQVKILRGAAAVTLYINGAGILLLGIELSSTLHGGSIFSKVKVWLSRIIVILLFLCLDMRGKNENRNSGNQSQSRAHRCAGAFQYDGVS